MVVARVEAQAVAMAGVEAETVEAIDTVGLVMYLVVARLIVHVVEGELLPSLAIVTIIWFL